MQIIKKVFWQCMLISIFMSVLAVPVVPVVGSADHELTMSPFSHVKKIRNSLKLSPQEAIKFFGKSYNPLILSIVNKSIDKLNITTPEEAAHLFSQLACESARLSVVDGRFDPNKIAGKRYHGRGVIQLTGIRNYRKAQKYFNIIFVGDSKEARRNRARLADPTEVDLNVKILCWYWNMRVRKESRQSLYKVNYYSILQVTRSIHDPQMSFETIRGEKKTKHSKWHKNSYWFRVRYTKKIYKHYQNNLEMAVS